MTLLKRDPQRFVNPIPHDENSFLLGFARLMKTWAEFEAGEDIFDHVIRYLPRDYQLSAQMKEGDQYPDARWLALVMFDQEISRIEDKGNTVKPRSSQY